MSFIKYEGGTTIPEQVRNNTININYLNQVLTTISTDPTFLENVVNGVIGNSDFKNGVAKIVSDEILNDPVLKQELIDFIKNEITNDPDIKTIIGNEINTWLKDPENVKLISNYIVADKDFLNIVVNAVGELLAVNTEFVKAVGDAVSKLPDFINDVSNNLISDNTFITNVGSKLSTNTDFLNKVATNVTPLLINPVADSLILNERFVSVISMGVGNKLGVTAFYYNADTTNEIWPNINKTYNTMSYSKNHNVTQTNNKSVVCMNLRNFNPTDVFQVTYWYEVDGKYYSINCIVGNVPFLYNSSISYSPKNNQKGEFMTINTSSIGRDIYLRFSCLQKVDTMAYIYPYNYFIQVVRIGINRETEGK